MDYPQSEVTTKHIFTTKKQRQYPQTRRVVHTPKRGQKRYAMSYSSTAIDHSEDELEQFDRSHFSAKSSSRNTPTGLLGSPIVQEVSLSHSAPLTIIPPSKDVPLTVHIEQGTPSRGGVSDLPHYISQYEPRVSRHRPIESVERVNARGHHETEFPVQTSYIGGDSIVTPHSVPVVNVGHTYRTYDPRSPRIHSALSDTVISETTTIEELTTITTTNQRRRDGEMSPTSVNALTRQFENSARQERREVDRTTRRTPQGSPRARVVVVSKPPTNGGGEFVYSAEEARVRRVERAGFSPSDQPAVVSTTIVDIDPGYRTPRYIEETYQVQEEYRSIKTYGGGKKQPVVVTSPQPTREYIKESIREQHISTSRGSSPAREQEVEQSRGTTPVRSVVEQFESRIDEPKRPKPYGKVESIDKMAIIQKEIMETTKREFREEYTPTPTRIAPSPPPVGPPRPTPSTPPASPKTPKEKPSPPEKADTVDSRTKRVDIEAWEEITTTRKNLQKETKEETRAELPPPPPPPPAPPVQVPPPRPESPKRSTFSEETTEIKTKYETRPSPIPPKTDMTEKTTTYSSSISSRTAAPYTRTVQSSSQSYVAGSGRFSALGTGATVTGLSGMSPFSQNAASFIRETREREKREMSDLNDRLASYIEKVRFLEAQNRKLANDLEMLQSRWGSDSSTVRVMYESELKSAKAVIDDSNRQREGLEQEIRRLLAELADYRKRYEQAVTSRVDARGDADDLLEKLAKLEAEINLVKRRINYLEEEVNRIKAENSRLMGELSRNRTIIEQESLQRIGFQNEVQALLEECQYVGRVHSSELGDLVVMAHRDTTPENREFFKNELAAAIRDIRSEYDTISATTRNEMESWYKLKVQEIHTQSSRNNMEQTYAREEVKKLRITLSEMRSKLTDLEARNTLLEKQIQELTYQLEEDERSYSASLRERDEQVRKMRDECQALMVELQMLIDTKQTLDAEIAIYRKMLEGEENRAGLRQLVEQVVKTSAYDNTHETTRLLKGETASYSTHQRTAKGNVSVTEVSPDGRFIVLENTHRSKEQDIGGWKLKRRIDGKKEYVFTFPKDFVLKPLKTVKIFARGQGVHSPPDSFVFDDEETWGTGNNAQTYLFNKDGEERATHIQRHS